MRFNRRYVLLILLFAALITLFLPIKVNYSFEAMAKIYPVREWFLKRGQDDSYITEMQNYKTNVLSHLKSFKFERGDISEIIFSELLNETELVDKGDTLAYINSYFIENELIRLQNLKNVEEGNLSSSLVGTKEALIAEAEQRYNFAKQQLDLETKNIRRFQKLYEDSVISTAEFDIYQNTYKLAEINAEIAFNELEDARTGVKREDIALIRQQIAAYEREIANYEKLKSEYFVVSPIGGLVSFNQVINGILTVSDTSNYILKIPVKVNNVRYLDRITGIRFSIPGQRETIDASFLNLDENVSLMSNQQLVMAKALISGGNIKLYPGMAVQCMVLCDRITFLEYLSRSIQLHF
jgi:NACalpha-BTF3-like transcription factor